MQIRTLMMYCSFWWIEFLDVSRHWWQQTRSTSRGKLTRFQWRHCFWHDLLGLFTTLRASIFSVLHITYRPRLKHMAVDLTGGISAEQYCVVDPLMHVVFLTACKTQLLYSSKNWKMIINMQDMAHRCIQWRGPWKVYVETMRCPKSMQRRKELAETGSCKVIWCSHQSYCSIYRKWIKHTGYKSVGNLDVPVLCPLRRRMVGARRGTHVGRNVEPLWSSEFSAAKLAIDFNSGAAEVVHTVKRLYRKGKERACGLPFQYGENWSAWACILL